MSITSGAALWQYGTQTTVIAQASGSAPDSFSSNVTALTQTDYCPLGDATLDITYTSAPTAGDAIHLYRRDLNFDGTNDAVTPDANFKHTYMGSFALDPAATRQYHTLTDIPLVIDQEFYIEFDVTTHSTATNSTTVKVTPKAYNVKT